MKKFLIIIFLFSISLNNALSQNDGTANTGLSFLKLGVGAQSISMGEAYSPISEDATSIYYNPARLFFGAKTNIYLAHNSSMTDFTNDFIAFKTHGDKWAIGFGVQRAAVNDIEIREIPGAPLGKFNAENLSIGLSVGFRFSSTITLGVTSKFLYEKIYVDDASGLAFDLGIAYEKNNFSAAFVLTNLGEVNELKSIATKLPSAIRFGVGYRFGKGDFKFRSSAEGFQVTDGGKFHIHSGLEAGYKDMFFLRAGFQSNYENKNFTAGIGFKYNAFTLDYSYVPYKYSFSNSNTFSLGLSF